MSTIWSKVFFYGSSLPISYLAGTYKRSFEKTSIIRLCHSSGPSNDEEAALDSRRPMTVLSAAAAVHFLAIVAI